MEKSERLIYQDSIHRYFWIKSPKHLNANKLGYVKRSVLIMSTFLKRPLTKDEVVHHIDGDRTNDSLENLSIESRSSHAKIHNKKRGPYRNTDPRMENKEWLKEQYVSKKMTLREIAKQCKGCTSTLRRNMISLGIPLRANNVLNKGQFRIGNRPWNLGVPHTELTKQKISYIRRKQEAGVRIRED